MKVYQNEFCYASVEYTGKRVQKNSPEIIYAVTEHNISDDHKSVLNNLKCEAFNGLKLHTERTGERTHHVHIPTKKNFINRNTKSIAL